MIVKTQSSRPYGGPCLSKFYVGSSTREELVFDFNLPETKQRYESEVAKRLDVALDIEDIRGREADFTLFRNGFQYVRHELPPGLQSEAAANYTEEEVAAVLVAPTENLVKEMTGAFKIMTAGYRLRYMDTGRDKRSQLEYRGPSHEMHSDFSAAGAREYLASTMLKDDPAALEALSRKRILVVNAWRPLRPIERDPLAIADWAALDPAACLVHWRVSFEGGTRQNESHKVRPHDSQKWKTLRAQLPSEPVLFLCFDSSREYGMAVPHGSFVDPEYEDSDTRISFEVKIYCFLDE